MLNKKDKKDFINDGRSKKRQDDFRKIKESGQRVCASLDDYLEYLAKVQNVFSPFESNPKKTTGSLFKL